MNTIFLNITFLAIFMIFVIFFSNRSWYAIFMGAAFVVIAVLPIAVNRTTISTDVTPIILVYIVLVSHDYNVFAEKQRLTLNTLTGVYILAYSLTGVYNYITPM